MRKGLVFGLAAMFVLSGCGSTGEKIPDAVETLTKAVDDFNANDKTSLQMVGTFSSTYNNTTDLISLSALYQGDKAENQVNSVLSLSYTNGTYMDYHYLTDNEHFIAYCQTGELGSSSDETTATGDSAENSDETQAQSAESTSVYSLDEETFDDSIRYGTIDVPFAVDDVKKVTTEENEETGALTWKFELKPKSSEETAKWLLESIHFIDTSTTDISFKVNSLECDARYKDTGELSYVKYILDVVMTAQNEDLQAKYSISYITAGTGDDVKVSLPDMEELEETAKAQEQAYNEYLDSLEAESSESEAGDTENGDAQDAENGDVNDTETDDTQDAENSDANDTETGAKQNDAQDAETGDTQDAE